MPVRTHSFSALLLAATFALAVLATACADDEGGGSFDAGVDAGSDAGVDLGIPSDTGSDTGGLTGVAIQSSGLSVRIEFDPFSFEVKDPNGRVVLRSADMPPADLDPSLEGRYGPPAVARHVLSDTPSAWFGWDADEGESEAWWPFDRVVTASSLPGSAHVELASNAGPATLAIDIVAIDNRLQVSMDVTGAPETPWLAQSFLLGEDEHFFGLGGRIDGVDRRGGSYRGWVEASGVGRGEGRQPGPRNPEPNGADMTGFPIPFVLSSRGYGFWLESSARWQAHLGSERDDHWRLEVADSSLRYTLFVNTDPLKTLAEYTELSGRPTTPPEWLFGPRRYVRDDAEVFEMPEWLALREFGVATTTIEDEDNAFVDPASNARRVGASAELQDLGYHRIGRISPFLSAVDEASATAYSQAVERDFVVTDESGAPYLVPLTPDGEPEFVAVDVSTGRAGNWFVNQVPSFLDDTPDGWRIENLEHIPADAYFGNGDTGTIAHNAFPVWVQEALLDATVDADGSHPAFIANAGYSGSGALLDMVWSGPFNTSFEAADGLGAAVRAGINLGLSGLLVYGTDVGGNDAGNGTSLDRELLLRWSAFAAFAPGMASGGALSTAEGWTIWSDDETLDVFAEHALLHTRLAPYLHAVAAAASERGAPMMRHPFLHHPLDASAMAVDDSYYLGDSLLVAPVIERGATSRSVYLPEGVYVAWQSREVLTGGQTVVVEAPIGAIPVFMTAHAIVPLYDARIDTLGSSTREDVVDPGDVADVLDVRAVASPSAEPRHLSLVDGTSLGVHLRTRGTLPIVTAPYGNGGGSALRSAADEADLVSCAGCYLIEGSGPRRLRVTTTSAETSHVVAGELELVVMNPAGQPRRIRWDVVIP